ncbi:hypothetical protein HC028_23555 [Planosporangium flavigriseum]|uniref:hypothetical protein n=1 Tax=Planosporangium flavigriseum TaxID=373681 RepID=UPI00143C3CC6|nr:hypothetical protein [Planosporangium flavigriseum]NJC67452.1 hypothetical protein [Planosporangium flavigriseum]
MALQHAANSLIDRFVLAVVHLFAATCLTGLAMSFWPWLMEPVPAAGVALTVVTLLAAMTGRLRRPARVLIRPVERLLSLVVALVAAVALVPYVARDLGGRIGMPLTGEDITRHFLMYDMIGRVRGYLFLHPEALRPYVPDGQLTGTANYPQGIHLTYAVVAKFIPGADADPIASLNILTWLLVTTYILFGAAVLWSARRIAGPAARSAQLLPVLLVVAAWLSFGDPITVLARGYPNQLAGLAAAAVLTALAARPLASRGDQFATVVALVVAVAYSYPLYLPYAVVAAGYWAWRERLWRYWWSWVGVLVFAPLAALSLLAAVAASGDRQLLLPGLAHAVDRPATVVLLALAVAGLVVRGGLRSPARRSALFAVGGMTLIVGAVAAYQIAMVGRTVYYFDKLLHLLIVVCLVALGASARLMPREAPAADRRQRRRALVRGVALAMPLVLAMALLGGAWHTSAPSRGLQLLTGRDKGSPAGARDAILMTRMYRDGGGAINVSLMAGPWRNWYATQLASTLQGRYRYVQGWAALLYPLGRPPTLADLDGLVASSPVPVRFFLYNEAASMLVVDSDHPNRPRLAPGAALPVAFGDPAAPTNAEAARLLAARYPGKVEIVYATPPNQ